MTRPDGDIVWYNQRWYEYTGTTPGQTEGWNWQSVHDPAELPRVLANWQAALAAGTPWEDTFPLRRHDGQMRWHLSRAFPVRDEQGRIQCWFGTNTDITDRMQWEIELKAADHRKDEFLTTLVHELRNPLAPLRNALQVLRRASENPTEVERVRGLMERQLHQMTRLIDDLSDVSRIRRNKLPLQKERVELADVLARAIETSRPLIDAAGHELTVSQPHQPILLDADPTRLAQVFANLLNNAAKYTERGGHIELTVCRHGHEAVVNVRDNGIGIPAEMLPHIFEMFTQVEHAQERAQGGIGVGLTLVQRLVEMQGGSVEARSEGTGRGSEFLVRLPIVVPPSDQEAVSKDGVLETRRILVVDDNPDATASLGMVLQFMGCEVRTATDGLEALEVAEAFQPEVVLLDIGLPKLNGYAVARRMRERPWGKCAILIATTGWGQEEDRRRSLEAGFDDHWVKPLDPAALKQLLAKLLSAPV